MSPQDTEMPLAAHLEELRGRLGRSIAAIFVLSLICFGFADALFDFFTGPLRENFTEPQLIGTGVADAFIVKLKVALICGIIVSAPYCFYEAWRFIAPGLHQQERSMALPFVAASSFFFFIGIAFCFFVVLPFAFQFFESQFVSIGVAPAIRIGEYLTFVTKLLLVFGIIFELPVATYFLARLELISSKFLIEKARVSVVGIFVVAAILTPPDVLTQILLAIPLLILYALCIWVAQRVERGRTKPSSEQQT